MVLYMNGKGDKDNRISDREKYRKNFDLIFSMKVMVEKPVENIVFDFVFTRDDEKEVDRGQSGGIVEDYEKNP